jgi:hypothetical protein
VTEARELAVRVHADQRDRDGSFHIGHVARVAEAVPTDESHQRVAWLHDVLEDSEMTAFELRAWLTADELQALVLLTHDNRDEPYEKYVARIIDADGAAAVSRGRSQKPTCSTTCAGALATTIPQSPDTGAPSPPYGRHASLGSVLAGDVDDIVEHLQQERDATY